MKWYHLGTINKKFNENEQPEGWTIGRYVDKDKQKVANELRRKSMNSKHWFHNPTTNESGYFEKCPDGWVEGRASFTRDNSKGKHIYNDGKKEYFLSEEEASNKNVYPGRLDSTLENMRQTCLEKYGVDNFFKTDAISNYWNENFNISSPMQLDKVKEKSRQTCLDKYGHEYYFQTEEFRDKATATYVQKYGVDHSSKNEDVKAKVAQTKKDRYGVSYYNNPDKVTQTCKKRYGLSYACLLPQCRLKGNNSRPNLLFSQLLEENNIKYEREYAIGNKQFDFKVGNNLIEINPTYSHNSTNPIHGKIKDKNYHYDKSNLAKENGFRCIHIWDWDDKNKIVDLLKDRKRIFARKCEVKNISQKEANIFIEQNHLQGTAKASIFVGLFYNNELVSVMTFGKPRYNKNYEYELVRYCSIYNVIGGAEKLFRYFQHEYNPKSVISYCDLAKFNGQTYEKLGFELKSINIGKHWYNTKTKIHITDNLLRQRGFDQLFNSSYGKDFSNEELMKQAGFVEMYDSGQATFILNFKE